MATDSMVSFCAFSIDFAGVRRSNMRVIEVMKVREKVETFYEMM